MPTDIITTTAPNINVASIGQRAAVNRHPLYDVFEDEWIDLANVREGTGGFLDGTYLIAHPREWLDHDATTPVKPTAKLKARRKLARYENLAAAIIEAKRSTLFRETALRRVGTGGDDPTELEQWWDDIDGEGTSIDQAMPAWWDLAATFGHCVLWFRTPDNLDVDTAAEQASPEVRAYTPLDVINWITDTRGVVRAVKLVEAIPAATFEASAPTGRSQIRVLTETESVLFSSRGELISRSEHGLGRLPVTYLYGRRRSVVGDLGQSVLGDPRAYIDLYNLTSELRELLRNQTFSFINVPLGTGADALTVETAQQQLGQQMGTMNVLFSGLQAQILTGDASNVTAYQDDIKQLKRDIFRVTGVQWESDTRDAESGDSLRLKREDMNTRLAQYADECQQAELDLVDLWYRWRHGPDLGPIQRDDDQVTVQYPDRFDPTPFEELLNQIQAAKDIGMPPLFLKNLRKSIIGKFEGMADLDTETLAQIQAEIDAAEDEPSPAEQARQRLELQRMALQRPRDDEDKNDDPDDESPTT